MDGCIEKTVKLTLRPREVSHEDPDPQKKGRRGHPSGHHHGVPNRPHRIAVLFFVVIAAIVAVVMVVVVIVVVSMDRV